MRRVWGGSALAMAALLLRVGAARAQESDPVGTVPWRGVVRPPRHGGVMEPYRTPGATTYDVLDEMASRASVMFVGTVTSVRWMGGGQDAAAGVVAVDFLVEEGIVGPPAGTRYGLREWAGLWRDAPRYRVGQRRLMLLHAPGPGGLSSPVDGLDGAIPVTGGAELRADLRWVQAKQLRAVTLAGEPGVGGPGEQAAEPLALGTGVAVARAVVTAGPLRAETMPPLADVVGRLRAGGAAIRAER